MTSDFHVSVVAWSGRLSELAARFNMPADVLARQLRRLSNAPPVRGNLIVPVDSPTAIHTLRHRLRLAMVED